MAVALIPLSLLFYLNDQYSRVTLTDNANRALLAAASETALHVDLFISNNLNAIATEAQLPDFIKYLSLPAGRRKGSAEEVEATSALFALSRKDQANIASYALLDRRGLTLIDTFTPDIGVPKSDQDYFRFAAKGGEPYASPVLFLETGNASIYFSAAVRDTAAGEIIGVLYARYSASVLEQIIVQKGELAGRQSYAILLDENHVRLAHGTNTDLIFKAVVSPDPIRAAELQAARRLPHQPIKELVTNQPVFEQGLLNADKQPFFTAYLGTTDSKLNSAAVAKLRTQPWLIVFAQPQAVFLASVQTQGRMVLLLGLGVAAAVVVVAIGMARLLTRPVVHLTAVARQVSEGNLDAKARVESQDEIGVLAEAFNSMTSRLVETLQGLRASEESYRGIFENAVEGVFRTSVEGQLLSANPAMARILAYDAPDELVASLSDVRRKLYVHPEDRDVLLGAILDQGTVNGLEFQFRRKDKQTIWASINARLVRNNAGAPQFIEGFITDITERKRAEEEIRMLNQELEQRVLNRTAELETANKEMHAFTYTVSHDLRAPLRHIDGFLGLLEKKIRTALDEQSRQYMNTISGAANKMGLLIDDLLSFSRMGRHAMSTQPVALEPLVHNVIRELEPDAAGRDIDWRIGDLPAVRGDAALLRMVLDNLIANAVKFTRPRQQAQIEIGFLPGQDAETVIFVRDNGVGFDMAYADKLFGVFQRLHRAEEFEGTGIGLANVRRIIARHGGRVWAEGEVDKGATFYFSLPKPVQAD
ncbi:MAG: ATP-binding protein [Pseudomonadota bacterium]